MKGKVGVASLSAPWREKPSQVATHKWPRQMLFYLREILENFSSVLFEGKNVLKSIRKILHKNDTP